MRRLSHPVACLLLFASSALVAAPARAAPPLLEPARPVYDVTGKLAPETIEQLTTTLNAFHAQSGHRLLVCLYGPAPSGEDAATYAANSFHRWTLSQTGNRNAAALMIFMPTPAPGARRYKPVPQAFLIPGNGLVPHLPQGTCQQLIETIVAPPLAAGDYNGAALAGTNAIIANLTGQAPAPIPPKLAPPAPKGPTALQTALGIGGFLLSLFLARLLRRSYTRPRPSNPA